MAEDSNPPKDQELERKLDPLIEEMIQFGISLYHRSRFFSSPTTPVMHALRESIGSLRSVLDPASVKSLFRARIHEPRMMKPEQGPYRGPDILNPPLQSARAGRLNCSGISRLYLASTMDVAAAEVRAVTGDFVTIATFELSERVRVFDFREVDKRAAAAFRELLAYISRIISSPVYSYDNYECILSQWVTEYMERLGVDAVIFPSVMRGQDRENRKPAHKLLGIEPMEYYNVCAFSPRQFKLVAGSETVMRVRQLSVSVYTDDMYYRIRALREVANNPDKYLRSPKE